MPLLSETSFTLCDSSTDFYIIYVEISRLIEVLMFMLEISFLSLVTIVGKARVVAYGVIRAPVQNFQVSIKYILYKSSAPLAKISFQSPRSRTLL